MKPLFSYLRVGHPAAGLHLVGVQAPVLQLLLEERAADICRVVQFPGSVVIQNLSKNTGVPVEEVLVEDRVVVAERLGQPRQPRRRNLLERRLVRLVPDAAAVQDQPVLDIHAGVTTHHKTVRSSFG